MTDAHIYAGTLLATADDRTYDALLVPYGEQCSSNLGRFAVDTGAFTIPTDPRGSVFNTDHEREHVNGEVVSYRETPQGVRASVYFAKTDQGDTALRDVLTGKRRAISAEVADVVIRAGRAVSGRIFGAALVREGAFPSATLLAAAVDIGEEPAEDTAGDAVTTTEHNETEYVDEQGVTWRRVEDTETTTEADKTTTTTTVVEETEDPDAEPDPEEEEENVTGATAPATLTARKTKTAPARAAVAPSFRQIMRDLNAIKQGTADSTLFARIAKNAGPSRHTLFASLDAVAYSNPEGTAIGDVIAPFPQWLGELWDGLAYERDVIDVITTDSLTARTIAGWRWETKPKGGPYAGNSTAVASNTPKMVPYQIEAAYWAGAHKHANEFKHFPSAEYWESYYKAMREDYAEWSNETAFGELKSHATAATPDAVPAGLAKGLSYLVDAAAEVTSARAIPSFAFVETALYKAILKTTNNNVLGYLDAALGFTEGTLGNNGFRLKPRSSHLVYDPANPEAEPTEVPFKGVLAGAGQAATFHELPGVPIRVEAEDVAHGSTDTGLFGYAGTVIHKAKALVHVQPAAGGSGS
ncbi:hypothetical protein [Plantibacter sp. YIM 135249]|uniref:hypothetical protein n=1 Tax=Plantibacter sp. YIM 135249 TaxID=3423918 RepID=UPI003D337BE6